MSTRDDLLADVVEQVQDAIESGLAARGLLGRLDARHLRIWKASESAGLVIADFVANLAYNRDRAESARLVDALIGADRLRLFQGLGGYAERRARVAERDGDLALAIARWAMIDAERDGARHRDAELIRLWRKVLHQGATGPSATLEGSWSGCGANGRHSGGILPWPGHCTDSMPGCRQPPRRLLCCTVYAT